MTLNRDFSGILMIMSNFSFLLYLRGGGGGSIMPP